MRPLADMGQYATVVIDPPWSLPIVNWSKHGYKRTVDYPTMSIEDIAALPVPAILADNAFLFVWTTNRLICETFQLMHVWDVKYWFLMTWVKTAGTQFPGSPCFNSEWCLVGRKGKPDFLDTKAFRIANSWPRREHSAKPEEFYDLLRRVTPGPRLDIFNRRVIAGFASWGNEAPEQEVLLDHWQIPMT